MQAFLQDKIGFYDIPRIIEKVLEKGEKTDKITLEGVLQADKYARQIAKELF